MVRLMMVGIRLNFFVWEEDVVLGGWVWEKWGLREGWGDGGYVSLVLVS